MDKRDYDGHQTSVFVDGTRTWYFAGQIHRIDGPARIWTDGYVEWWVYGEFMTFDAWLTCAEISDEDLVMFKLQYG